MFDIIKRKRFLVGAITSGVIGLAIIGFCNTAAAVVKANEVQDASSNIVLDTATQAGNITGCPGNCAACGICSGTSIFQTTTIMDIN
jgi:hypothetical protein